MLNTIWPELDQAIRDKLELGSQLGLGLKVRQIKLRKVCSFRWIMAVSAFDNMTIVLILRKPACIPTMKGRVH